MAGDIGMDHVFVNEGRICGIIDFGLAQGGAGIMDLAIWTMYHPDIPVAALLSGYGDARVATTEGQRERIAHQVNTTATHLAHNMRDGNHNVRDLIVAALRESLDTWQGLGGRSCTRMRGAGGPSPRRPRSSRYPSIRSAGA